MPSDVGLVDPKAGAFSLEDLASPKPEVDPKAVAVRKELLSNAIAQGIQLTDADLEEAKGLGLRVPDPRINQIRQGLQSIPTQAKPGDVSLTGMFKGIVDNFLGLTSAAEQTGPLKPTDIMGVGLGASPASPFMSAAKVAPEAAGAALDAVHATIQTTPDLSSADIHGMIDQAVGLPKGWTVWKNDTEQAIKGLNAVTDTAVKNGTVTAEEAKSMDSQVAALAKGKKSAIGVDVPFEVKDSDGKVVGVFDDEDKTTKAAAMVGGTYDFSSEYDTASLAPSVKVDVAKAIENEFLSQMKTKYGDAYSAHMTNAEDNIYDKLAKQTDEAYGAYTNAAVAKNEPGIYSPSSSPFAPPPSAASHAQTALEDFEGEMESKYNAINDGTDNAWTEKMSVDEMAQHDQLLSDVMTHEQLNDKDMLEGASFPNSWTHQIEDFINRAPTDKESTAINYYSASSIAINRLVGKGEAPHDDEFTKLLHEHINAFDNMFQTASSPKTIVIYRGESVKSNWDMINSVPIGKTFVNKAFTSSSASKDIARSFERLPTGTLTVIVPKGSKVIPFSAHSNLAYEDEVLIARGTEFRVVAKTPRNITIEVVPNSIGHNGGPALDAR